MYISHHDSILDYSHFTTTIQHMTLGDMLSPWRQPSDTSPLLSEMTTFPGPSLPKHLSKNTPVDKYPGGTAGVPPGLLRSAVLIVEVLIVVAAPIQAISVGCGEGPHARCFVSVVHPFLVQSREDPDVVRCLFILEENLEELGVNG